jgi:hypothetical protein
MTRWIPALVATLALLLPGCGDDGTSDDGEASVASDLAEVAPLPEGGVVVDMQPGVPVELLPGTSQIDFPEQIIPAASEIQTCMFMEPLKETTFFKALRAFQGRYGHHLILFKTSAPEEPGTVRDCTEAGEMKFITPVLSSVNFGLEKFPEGMALEVEAGAQLVVQQHYVNTSEEPIRVRDSIHVETVRGDSVQELAGFYGISELLFQLEPTSEDTTLRFECTIPADLNLLMVGPHMHEWGTQFYADVGAAENPTRVIDIPEWEAEYRDDPPVAEFSRENPLAVSQGDVIRTTCVWQNTTDHVIGFPEEMCATYGYFFPATPEMKEWTCAGTVLP